MLTLTQAEWCPYSSAVRQRLTELGLDFVARQVEPREAQRTAVDQIPTLETEDGIRFQGTDAIFEYLATLAPPGSTSARIGRSTGRTGASGRRRQPRASSTSTYRSRMKS
jgi:glutathione S-transferase